MKKLLCVLFSMMMCITLTTPAFAIDAGGVDGDPNGGGNTPDTWQISLDKYVESDGTGTRVVLDENKEAKVSLQLPANEEQLASAIVFCIDKSFSGETKMNATINNALTELSEQVALSGAKVKVGFVIFNKMANALFDGELVELNPETLESIKTAINSASYTSGTNLHAGIEASKKMLDSIDSNEIIKSRRHLVVLSDGLTYLFNHEGKTSVIFSQENDDIQKVGVKCSLDANQIKYKDSNNVIFHDFPTVDKNYMDSIEQAIQNGYKNSDGSITPVSYYYRQYEGVTDILNPQFDNYIPYSNREKMVCSFDIALYKAYSEYQSAKAAGYNCHVYEHSANSARWANEFVNLLQEGQSAKTFDQITNDIIYMLGSGSYVTDPMGTYFDFVSDLSKMKMVKIVGEKEEEIPGEMIEKDHYGFGKNDDGKYDFEIIYDGSDLASDGFLWEINTNVSRYAPVRFTYSVKLSLTDDEFAEEFGYDTFIELLTNGTEPSATLYPVSSNEKKGASLEFPDPTVLYQVKKGTTPEEKPGDDPNENHGGSSTITPKPVVNTAVK